MIKVDALKADRPGGKFDKTTVDYSHGLPHAHCGLCAHYDGEVMCELVDGGEDGIEPQMWCELFAPGIEKGSPDQPRDEHGRWQSSGDASGKVVLSNRSRALGDKLVGVDAQAVDAAWKKDESFHVGPGGSGPSASPGKYERAGEFIASSNQVYAPELGVMDDGRVGFTDGRHRFAAMRDMGIKVIPVAMDRESIANARKFGYLKPLKKSLAQLFEKAVTDAFTFDRFDEATQQWLREQQDELIAELEDSVRDTIEQVIASGVREGLSVEDMAADIRDTIGLTDRQAQAVMNYRSMLEDLDPDALDRQLRAAGFDEMLQEAIDNDIPLDEAAVNTMVDVYESNYLDYRADTIAQTESVRMANAGLQDAYEQAIDRGALPADAVRQYWQIALDEKTCPICESIPDNNPDGVMMGEDFDSDDGPQDQPPVHPSCRCSVEIVTDLDQIPDEEAA